MGKMRLEVGGCVQAVAVGDAVQTRSIYMEKNNAKGERRRGGGGRRWEEKVVVAKRGVVCVGGGW